MSKQGFDRTLDRPRGYNELLGQLVRRVERAQVRAVLAVNRELVALYWEIGREILRQQTERGWGAKVIDHLSQDLRARFPQQQGFSARNLKYMRSLAKAWEEPEFVQQPVAQIPWGHHCALLDRVKEPGARRWYAEAALAHGWSRAVLVHQIELDLFHRQGRAQTNFDRTLPPPQSDLAHTALKDPYVLEFLDADAALAERELERQLILHIRDFLMELGVGFSFVGSQYALQVGEQDFFIDLLFYHLRLRAFVVVELKTERFEPSHLGQLNFYVEAVDRQLRHPTDHPTIGLLLCKDRDETVVEWSLQSTRQPIGVAEFQTTRALPEALQDQLPSTEQLQAELDSGSQPPHPAD